MKDYYMRIIFLCIFLFNFVFALDYVSFRENDKLGVKDKKGNIIIPAKFEDIDTTKFGDGLMPAQVQIDDYKNWGFINLKGDFVIAPTFERVKSGFIDGLAIVYHCGMTLRTNSCYYNFIDKHGNKISEQKYFYDAKPFSEGLALVQSANDYLGTINPGYGYINKTGKFVIEPKYDFHAKSFSEGLAVVAIGTFDKKYGYIDKLGNMVIPTKFENASSFKDGLALVEIEEDGERYYSLINKKGDLIANEKFHRLNDFQKGIAVCSVEKEMSSNELSALEAELANSNYKSSIKRMISQEAKYKYGAIDRSGKWVIRPKYQYIDMFLDGFARAKIDDKFGMIDKSGKWIIEPKYKFLDKFSEGLAAAQTDNGYGYIDKKGKMVISPNKTYITVSDFKNGLAIVSTKYISPTYKEIRNGLRGKYVIGFINKKGEVIIPPKYISRTNSIAPYFSNDNIYKVELNGKHGFINKKGEECDKFGKLVKWSE